MKIYECPICHRKFSENDTIKIIYFKANKKELLNICPDCYTTLIKSDNGEYIEYED